MATAHHVRRAGAQCFARRRLQAPQFSVCIPGAGPGGPQTARRGARGNRSCDRDRGDGGARSSLVAEFADILQIGSRSMENYSLAGGGGAVWAADSAEARHGSHDRRYAALGPGDSGQRQPQRHSVRARHPHLRYCIAQYLRRGGHCAAQTDCTSSCDCRSQAMRAAIATWLRRWRASALPPGRMGCSSRCIPIPTRR